MLKILKLQGIDDSNEVNYVCGYPAEGSPQFHIDGIMPILQYLDHVPFQVQTILLGGKSSTDINLQKPQLLFNSICDPDNNSQSLKVATNIANTLADVAIVNHPQNIQKTTRENIYALCKDVEGLLVPKTLRVRPKYLSDVKNVVDEGHMKLPLIFRPAGGQGGVGMLLIEKEEDFALLEQFAFDGRDFYMIEYVDFISSDKQYRKYRYFVIAGKTYPGHMMISNEWNIHKDSVLHTGKQKAYSKQEQEEKAFLKKWDRKVSPLFKEVYEKIGLDYFGIDCAVDKKGNVVIFEINACMNIFSVEKDASYYSEKYKQSLKTALIDMFYEKAKL